MSPKISLFPLILLLFIPFDSTSGVAVGISFEEDTRLTKSQGQAFEKFKKRVIPKLKKDYQKEDMFLLRYFKSSNFDVPTAEKYLMTEMKWREEYKMDTILEEDWSDMERDYGMRVEGHDRDGRPLLVYELGDWDIRKMGVSGKMDRLLRWTYANWEKARRTVRDEGLAGKNVSRWTFVIDLKNINSVTNVNPASLPYYIGTATAYSQHFPKNGNKIFLVNAPSIFETVLTLVKPILDEESRELLTVYGKNQKFSWGPVFNEAIDPSQLPRRYGGLKEDP